MALPVRDPDPSAIVFARDRLGEDREPFAQRVETLNLVYATLSC